MTSTWFKMIAVAVLGAMTSVAAAQGDEHGLPLAAFKFGPDAAESVSVVSLSFSTDGRLLVANGEFETGASKGDLVQTWDIDKGEKRFSKAIRRAKSPFPGFGFCGGVVVVDVSVPGAAPTRGGQPAPDTLTLVDAVKGIPLGRWRAPVLSGSLDGSFDAGSGPTSVGVMDLASDGSLVAFACNRFTENTIRTSPDGKRLPGESDSIVLVRPLSGEVVRVIQLPVAPHEIAPGLPGDPVPINIRWMAISPAVKCLAARDDDGRLFVWRLDTGKELATFKTAVRGRPKFDENGSVLHPIEWIDDDTLVVRLMDGLNQDAARRYQRWRVSDKSTETLSWTVPSSPPQSTSRPGRLPMPQDEHGTMPWAGKAAFSPDARLAVCVGEPIVTKARKHGVESAWLEVFAVRDKKLLGMVPWPVADAVPDMLRFSGDSKRLALASADGHLWVTNTADLEQAVRAFPVPAIQPPADPADPEPSRGRHPRRPGRRGR
ncbi:MAG: hypothetical protein BroJett003_01420 [Planctomycetota bacterium]|nr:MAG: hypothetical protein BroJett003_01420 [Planctomycetota bacterium]